MAYLISCTCEWHTACIVIMHAAWSGPPRMEPGQPTEHAMLTLLCPVCGASIVAIASGAMAWHEKPLCVPVAKPVKESK